jgi:hypothetical protein
MPGKIRLSIALYRSHFYAVCNDDFAVNGPLAWKLNGFSQPGRRRRYPANLINI